MSIIDAPILSTTESRQTRLPFASAVVCTRNRGSLIISTVRTILENDYPDFELVLVDQSTDDESATSIKTFLSDPRLRYIRSQTTGLGLARDLAIREAKGEFIMITDDDCDVPTNWIARQVEAFLEHPQVAVIHCDVVAGKCDYTQGYIAAVTSSDKSFLITGIGVKEIQSIGIGAAIAVRRSIALKLGGFDPGLGAGTPTFAGEDTDVSLKALLNGYQLYRIHDVQVIHNGFRKYSESRKLLRGYMMGAGAVYGKLIKCGYWKVLIFLPALYWNAIVPQAVSDLRKCRIPRIIGRATYLTKGLIKALQTPIDHSRQIFKV